GFTRASLSLSLSLSPSGTTLSREREREKSFTQTYLNVGTHEQKLMVVPAQEWMGHEPQNTKSPFARGKERKNPNTNS
ncbi:MAG: hypothetical protein ACK4SB_17225, partial [Belliella pelovolcani]